MLEFRQPRASGGCSVFPFSFPLLGFLHQAPPIEISFPCPLDLIAEVKILGLCAASFVLAVSAPLDNRQVSWRCFARENNDLLFMCG